MGICWRVASVSAAFVLLAGCGGRTISRTTVQGLMVNLPDGLFGRDDIRIESISSLGGNHAIAEARIRTALKLERVQGNWVIREVRLGNRPWEKIDDFFHEIEDRKTADTRRLLETVAEAVDKYRSRHGRLPPFTDYVSLSDALSPDFLNPLVREDAWRQPLAAFHSSDDTLRLVSAGPDGKLGSADDVELIRRYGR